MLYYTEEHEWLSVEGDIATVGITDHAAQALGDIVYFEASEIGTQVRKGDAAATVESVKAASEIYAPVDGEIIESNGALAERPELINSSPYGEGWLFRLRIADASSLDGLLDRGAYEALLA